APGGGEARAGGSDREVGGGAGKGARADRRIRADGGSAGGPLSAARSAEGRPAQATRTSDGTSRSAARAAAARGSDRRSAAHGLAQMLHRLADKLRPGYEALREQVRTSPVNYMDETSWYVGDPHWVLWVCTAPQYTLYYVDPSHGGPVAEKLLGPDYAGALVTDCHGAYRRLKCPQHKCIAHHL